MQEIPAANGLTPEISVVVPVYGCDRCLQALHRRLTTVLSALTDSYELIFVDDRSPDDSWSSLLDLAQRDSSIKLFRLSRNFGEEAALAAGLAQTTGRWTVVMDCDLQDAPEDIPRLYAKALEGYDIVFTKRKLRGHSRVRVLMSNLYFRLLSRLLETDVDPAYGNFSIASRKVVDHCLWLRDRDRHYRAILAWLGFNHTAIQANHARRYEGASAYKTRTLLKHAASGFFFETSVLLRWIVYAGFAVAAGGVLLAWFFILSYLINDQTYPGWTSLAVLILLLSGFLIASLGITALYVGRIFAQVKDRPLYVIDRAVIAGQVTDGELTDRTRRTR